MNNSKTIISITDIALKQIIKLIEHNTNTVYLRISVKQGGCAGMSYSMDFELEEKINNIDSIIDYNGFHLVCDNKSLLYLYGLSLDYQDTLIGGGFQFINPNAIQTCGCGKSFAI